MKRIQRLVVRVTRHRRQARGGPRPVQTTGPDEEEGTTTAPVRHDGRTGDLPHLPGAIWVTQVLPYLDRVSQNRLCATCRDIYITSKQFHFDWTWPERKFTFKRPILALDFSPDSQTLAIIPAFSKTILLWNRMRGMDQTLKGHKGVVSDVKFDATGIMASCSRTDGTVLIWSRNEPTEEEPHPRYTCINTLTLKVFALRYIRFSPCGEMIAVWGEDRLILLKNVHPGKTTDVGAVPWRFWPGIKCCETVVFLNQNQEKLLVYAYNNDQVRIWNYETKSVTALRDQERTVRAGDYDAYITAMATVSMPNMDGGGTQQYLVVGCRVGMLKIWDLEDYTCVRSFSMGPGWSSVTNMAFTRDGSTLACTGEGSQIRVFDVESSRCVAVLNDNKGRVEGLIFCPDGQCLVSGACDRTVRMWNMATLMSSAS